MEVRREGNEDAGNPSPDISPYKMPAFITNPAAIPPESEPLQSLPPLDTRYIINTQEKSTSAPDRGHGERIRRGSSFSI
jgi:hypothetical protein